ncbi:MAG: hypothetical protein OXH38_04705 [Chloroflexi bacterium]|nr:hypothetical protein [Chloroflexota bacterium]
MSPTEQERRCIDAVLSHLCRTTQTPWQVDDWPDDRHPNEPSPDALLTDGREDLALEIKQLTDGDTFHDHENSLRSLHRRLTLDTPRNYVVIEQPFLVLPRDFEWIGRTGIRRAARALEIDVGETAIVPVRRRSTVRFLDGSDLRLVVCQHQRSEEVTALSDRVDGCFLLEDAEQPEHQFLTERARLVFRRRLAQACWAARRDGEATIEWSEEWVLRRLRDSSEGMGKVSIVAPVAEFEEAAAIEGVRNAIHAARRKFDSRNWAQRSAVALHAGEQQSVVELSLFEAAIDRLNAADLQPLDLVFLVAGMRVRSFAFGA